MASSMQCLPRLLLIVLIVHCSGLSLWATEPDVGEGTAGLGVRTGPVPLAVQAVNGLSPGEGTMVRRVIPWAPAGQIGLQRGDVIIGLDGQDIDSRRDLRQEIWSQTPGTGFTVAVLRDGERLELSGQYGRIPDRIVERLRLPGEWWEAVVEAEQLRRLQALADAMDALQQELDQAKSGSAAQAAPEALPAAQVRDMSQLPLRPAFEQGLEAWCFYYKWTYSAPKKGQLEL